MHAPSLDRRNPPRLPRAVAFLLLALSGLYVWMIGNLPYVAFAFATYDDQLFVKLAAYILDGQWLGPYDETTLVKGPFFSLWIAADWLLNLPLLASEALLYAAACFLLLAAVRPHFRWTWPIVPIFLGLLLNPMAWDPQLLRVVREGLYGPLTLLVVALAAWCFGCPGSRRVEAPPAGWGQVGGGLALGLAVGCFWITREEGIWLLPTLGILWLGLWRGVRFGTDTMSVPPTGASRLARLGTVSVAALAGYAAIYGGLVALNRHVYGIANTVEFKQQDFLGAYGALARVSPDLHIRYVPVPAATLAKIAAVSPALAELMPALQNRRDAWTGAGCATQHVVPCDGEWRGGWFMWALRDAVKITGHYATPDAARAFYRRLSEEVNLACLDGRLACGPFRATITPVFRRDDIGPAVRAFELGMARLVHFAQSEPDTASIGTPYYSSVFFDLVEGPHLPRGPMLILRALVRAPGQLQSLAVSREGVGYSEAQIRPLTEMPPDGAGRSASRFDLQTDCTQPGCRLYLGWTGGGTSLPLADILKIGPLDRDGLRIETELSRDTGVGPVLPSVERGLRLERALQPVQRAYRTVMPVLTVLALALLLGQVVAAIRQRRADFILLLQLALWVGIGGRLALLGVLDATMFQGINPLYMAPLYPLLLAAVALALWRGGEATAAWLQRGFDEGWSTLIRLPAHEP